MPTIAERVITCLRSSRQAINFASHRVTLVDDATLELYLFTLPRYDVDVYENEIKQDVSDQERQEIVDDLLADRLWNDTMPYATPRP